MQCADMVLVLYILLGLSYSGGTLTWGLLRILRTHNCRVGLRHLGRSRLPELYSTYERSVVMTNEVAEPSYKNTTYVH
jgi:hypothetical protein